MSELNAALLGSSVAAETRAAHLADFDRALATIDHAVEQAQFLQFPGGTVEIKKPTDEQLAASARDWLAMAAEDAADLNKPGPLGEIERVVAVARLERHLAKARAALLEIGK